MRIVFVIILLNILCSFSYAAEISVKSFRKLDNDLDARITAPLKDQNGDLCAIIKVVTTQTGFSFDCGQIGIMKTVPKPAEIWVYVPYGTKRITISHPLLGQLRDYFFEPVQKGTVYELVLTTGRVETTVIEEIASQWLSITSQPAEALIYLNDNFVATGIYQNKIAPGLYSYRVEAPLYHTEAGKVELDEAGEKKVLDIQLKPAFGYLNINSLPESKAKIFIDGKLQNQTTPLKTGPIASGEHTVQIVQEMFQPVSQKVTVTDGQETKVSLQMAPNYATLSLNAPNGAALFINNEQVGTDSCSTRLGAGIYKLEARLDQHHPDIQNIQLAVDDNKQISLQPTPIDGSLDIVSIPAGATITINGQSYGETPNTVKLMEGNYTVMLSKADCVSVSREVTLSEGKTTVVNEKLLSGLIVSINSLPEGARLIIDDKELGNMPYTGELSFGQHRLKAVNGIKTVEQTITIAKQGGQTEYVLILGLENFTEIINGVHFDMVAVKGGTFEMGSNFGEENERPAHSVTVSDFFIGKYEVTQAQWEVVMGNNPSYFKGENNPVEQVSWNNVQKFIQKLNESTGKNYRLPTEAEWEFASQGNSADTLFTEAGTNNIDDFAWYYKNSYDKSCSPPKNGTQPVGLKKSNKLGIYDMQGNVWEWCQDWYDKKYYKKGSQNNPQGAPYGTFKVLRGGSCNSDSSDCSITYRDYFNPDEKSNSIGFRLAHSSN